MDYEYYFGIALLAILVLCIGLTLWGIYLDGKQMEWDDE